MTSEELEKRVRMLERVLPDLLGMKVRGNGTLTNLTPYALRRNGEMRWTMFYDGVQRMCMLTCDCLVQPGCAELEELNVGDFDHQVWKQITFTLRQFAEENMTIGRIEDIVLEACLFWLAEQDDSWEGEAAIS